MGDVPKVSCCSIILPIIFGIKNSLTIFYSVRGRGEGIHGMWVHPPTCRGCPTVDPGQLLSGELDLRRGGYVSLRVQSPLPPAHRHVRNHIHHLSSFRAQQGKFIDHFESTVESTAASVDWPIPPFVSHAPNARHSLRFHCSLLYKSYKTPSKYKV